MTCCAACWFDWLTLSWLEARLACACWSVAASLSSVAWGALAAVSASSWFWAEVTDA